MHLPRTLPALIAATTLIAGCVQPRPEATVASIRFDPAPLPTERTALTAIGHTPGATVTWSDGRSRYFPLHFRTLYRSGELDAEGNVAGLIADRGGRALEHKGEAWVSNRPDGTTVLRDAEGRPVVVTQFEESPGTLYAVPVEERADGWRPKRFQRIDFAPVEGTFINCAAVATPWNTHLVSEEDYDLDGWFFDPATAPYTKSHYARCAAGLQHRRCRSVANFERYLDGRPFNPYRYGYPLQVGPSGPGEVTVKGGGKHFAMGKGTHEMGLVMPDRRTVYLGDDGWFGGLYLFVADRAGELSSGTLYMARWEIDAGQANAPLQWVRIGHADDAAVAAIIERRPRIGEIFELADPAACPTERGFQLVRSGAKQPFCIKPRERSERFTAEELAVAAATLEKRKRGALLGATTEFHKVEGMTHDPDRNRLYLSASYVLGGMEKGNPGADHIRLEANRCGALFRLGLGRTADRGGRPIDSDYAALDMGPLVAGRPIQPGDPHSERNGCDPERIAGPDNIRYIGHDLLLIGEDTKYHFNNMAWAYDVERDELTRLLTLPTGGEHTGMFPDLTGERGTAIVLNVQHPLKDKAVNAEEETVNGPHLGAADAEARRGVVGYLDGLPPLDLYQP